MIEASRDTVRVLAAGCLDDQVAIVSGAGTGIGRAIAVRLVELGCGVVGFGRREEPLAGTGGLTAAGPGWYRWTSVDVRNVDAISAAVRSVGDQHGLTLLVNNAGGQFISPATDISPRGWRAVVELNLNAIFQVTQAAHPYLRRRGGAVVNMSLSGIERGSMGIAHSVAARAGVLGLTRSLVHEWSGDGIRLNCLGPGLVQTEALQDPRYAAALQDGIQDIPLGRPTSPWEVAELVAFLASPAGSLMTGQLLHVDGGAHLGAGLHMIPLPSSEQEDDHGR